jgi:hypothetical protein
VRMQVASRELVTRYRNPPSHLTASADLHLVRGRDRRAVWSPGRPDRSTPSRRCRRGAEGSGRRCANRGLVRRRAAASRK